MDTQLPTHHILCSVYWFLPLLCCCIIMPHLTVCPICVTNDILSLFVCVQFCHTSTDLSLFLFCCFPYTFYDILVAFISIHYALLLCHGEVDRLYHDSIMCWKRVGRGVRACEPGPCGGNALIPFPCLCGKNSYLVLLNEALTTPIRRVWLVLWPEGD